VPQNPRSCLCRRKLMTTAVVALALVGLSAISPLAVRAEATWPKGPVQLLVPASPGGGTDAAARIFTEALQKTAGISAVVVNLPGGGGGVAAEQVRNAAADGQTLLFFHTGLLSAYHTGGYAHDPLESFALVAEMPLGGSYALAVSASSPYQNVDDLVEAAKNNPGGITLGVQIRGATHFMAGLLESDSGAKFRVVEAGSDADKLVQLQGGQVEAALINTPGTLQYVEKGDLRILGTIAGAEKRDPAASDVPSVHEQGYPNVVYGLDLLVLAPLATDPEIVRTAHDAFAAAVAEPTATERLATMGMPISILPLDEGRARLERTSEQLAAIAKQLGLN
jgi:tripartite-type tricarboxylate transporter receptor subunit TctC